MRMRALISILVALVAASDGLAQLSEQYRTWLDGPEQFLVTSTEKKEFKRLSSDAEAEAFIRLFWARRDPNLETRANEFQVEFEARVAQADREFGFAGTRGALSDRGRLLIVLGPPDGVAEPDPTLAIPVEQGISASRGRFVEWVYGLARLPKGFREDVRFRLVETTRGANNFQMIAGDRKNVDAYRLLGQAPERLVLHPQLKEVPKAGLLAGARDATPAEVAALGTDPRPWPEGAHLKAIQGVEGAAHFPLWVHILLPPSTPAADLIVGRLTPAEGEAPDPFAVAARPLERRGGRVYELSIPLDAGTWRLEVALLAGSNVLAVADTEAVVQAPAGSGSVFSQPYISTEVTQEQISRFAPWTVGQFHVTPPAGDELAPASPVSAFIFVIRPSLDAAGSARKLRVILDVLDGERKVQSSPLGELAPDRVSGDVWALAFQFRSFHRPGSFRTELRLVDPTSGLESVGVVPMRIAASGG